MDELQLQRQVYHSQALNGNDCSQVLHPEPIKKFTNLLRPREIVRLIVHALRGLQRSRVSGMIRSEL